AAALALALVGPLADKVFEPLMSEGGGLAGSLGVVFGVGQWRGIALMLVCLGALITLLGLGSYLVPQLRRVEEDLPDVISEPSAVASVMPQTGEEQGTAQRVVG
ncbi:MAG TPA: hypothetical protein VEU50_46265, partial [Archangium sp.]|nr:hypothetical protein [Archangium sp.]